MLHPKIVFLNYTSLPEQTITFAIGLRTYTYSLPNFGTLDKVLYLLRKVSVGKAFALAKRLGTLKEAA